MGERPRWPPGRLAAIFASAFLVLALQSLLVGTVRAADGDFVPPHSSFAVDDDWPPDGLHDFLVVNTTVDIRIGGQFVLSASLNQSFPIGVIVFLNPGRHVVQLSFPARQVVFLGGGPYQVDLILEAERVLDTGTLLTQSYRISQFEGNPFSFLADPADTAIDETIPSDGLYDKFRIDVPLRVTESAQYSVWAYAWFGFLQTVVRLTPGDHTVALEAPGWEIRKAHMSGPFFMEVWASSTAHSYSTSKSFMSQSYDWSSFAGPPVALGPGIQDIGVDLDPSPDGRFDALEISIPIDVNVSGEYRVAASGFTMGPGRDHIGTARSVLYLAFGQRNVSVRLPAYRIAQGQLDGPYEIRCFLSDVSGRTIDQRTHITGPYNWTEFDPVPIELNGTIQDEYVDLDTPRDSVYDVYVARVPFRVNEPGTYLFQGFFDGSGAQFVATNATHLGVGDTVVAMRWPTAGFPRPDPTSPFQFHLSAYTSVFEPVLSLIHFPRPMPVGGSFPPPLLEFRDTKDVSLPDSDGDALFDSLDLNLSVETNRAGGYVFSGTLLSVENNLRVTSASNHTRLSAGPATVRISFPGWAIRASHLTGPYTIAVRYRPEASGPEAPWADATGPAVFGYSPALLAHDFDDDRPRTVAGFVEAPPVPDGVIGPGEWDLARAVSLETGDPGALPALALVANDRRNLYIALDVLGDRTADSLDSAGVAFDVLAPDDTDAGWEMQVGVGRTLFLPETEWRLQAESPPLPFGETWIIRQAPFDSETEERAQLRAAKGFGESPLESAGHRIYEFRIPLSLLAQTLPAACPTESQPGPSNQVGWAVFSLFTRGIRDGSGRSLSWPVSSPGLEEFPMNNLGKLVLRACPNVAPTVRILEPVADAARAGLVRVAGTAFDEYEMARVDVRIDDGPWSEATGTAQWSHEFDSRLLPDGHHTVSARSFDGSVFSDFAQVTINIDNTAPLVEVLSPVPNAIIRSHKIDVVWHATDSGAGVDETVVRLDDRPGVVPVPATNGSVSFENVTDGTHRVVVVVSDYAGNVRLIERSFVVDTSAPKAAEQIPLGALTIASLVAAMAAVSVGTYLLIRRRRGRTK